ncbi:M56 family metallopeptidase [Luteibacter pinisoli]|uniref:M56 family metallopeptidase n=1 Tax=Luteibacter pinisoli TaxID=2589080 RepID=A0A4Y5Z8E7_9GAMM|nr:M56 family metallopeptidase [Luteibacter pinisoli]QDE40615.1 M56 family metallopeptidase [Luteibacter pinisoli]
MDTVIETLLSRLAAASLQTVLFAAFIWALCRLMPSLSAATRSWMWWLVGAQMVLGLCIPGSIDLPLLPAPAPAVAATAAPSAAVTFVDVPASAATVAWSWSWTGLLLAAWAVLVSVQVAIGLVRWRRLAGVVSRALPHDDVRLETLCARRAHALGLRRSPRLAVSAEVDSPQVVGLLRPTILLPLDDTFGDEEREMALMHELAHVRRGDLLLGGVPALARTLFFFHPVAHVAVREYALCREAACDALAVDRGRLAPGTYGRLLLRLGVAPHPHHALPGASPTFRILKRRLDMLGQSQDARPRVITTLLVASLALAAALHWRVVAADQQMNTAPLPSAAPADTPAPAPAARPAPAAAPAVAMIVDKQSMPSPPATPPTPPTPPTPATPATPAAPAAPAALVAPAPPAVPPAPPAPSLSHSRTTYTTIDDHGPSRFQNIEDKTGYITIANEDGRWELRDPAYVNRIHAIYKEAFKAVPAEPRGMDRKREEDLDRQQSALNDQMHKLAERQVALAAQASDPQRATDRAAYSAGQAAISREQAEIGRQMAAIGQVRAEQGRHQAEWGQQQAEAARRANEKVEAVIAEARRNHALARVD